jgi:hypothetical protein
VKRPLMTLALACVFSSSAFAGDIPSVGSPAPPPPPSNATMQSTEPGDIQTPGKSELSSDALSALLSVLSFLGG